MYHCSLANGLRMNTFKNEILNSHEHISSQNVSYSLTRVSVYKQNRAVLHVTPIVQENIKHCIPGACVAYDYAKRAGLDIGGRRVLTHVNQCFYAHMAVMNNGSDDLRRNRYNLI